MIQSVEFEPIVVPAARKAATPRSDTNQTPLLLTKKWLCATFGLMCPGGKPNTHALYKKVLTPEVLAWAGLTEAAVRRRDFKTFDRTSSLRLIQALGL